MTDQQNNPLPDRLSPVGDCCGKAEPSQPATGLGVLSAGVPGRFQFMTSAAAQDKSPDYRDLAGRLPKAGNVTLVRSVPLTGAYGRASARRAQGLAARGRAH